MPPSSVNNPGIPRLSVIIASYNSRKTIEACLRSLENQSANEEFEIIVVDSSIDGTAQLIEEKFPQVRLYKFNERKFCGDARNFGISRAKGRIVAFIDSDCTADNNWICEIVNAHKFPYLAVGGAIANGNPDSHVGWAAYFCEFSQWMPARHARWMPDIAGASMSYKREVFEKYGDFIEGTYCSDTDFHWRLVRYGHRLRFMPTILIYHHNINKLVNFLMHEFHHGLSFAQVRGKNKRFPVLPRSTYIIFFFLIPIWLLLKIAGINLRNRVYLLNFLKSLPLLILGLISWSLGEWMGYIKAGR